MIYRCLIVDDEPPAIKILSKYIESFDQLELVGSCSNALKALELLQVNNVDLLFLDIEMPKLLGTEFLKSLPTAPKVIFTTAHREFAAEAFELNAVDYLLKPIPFERFLRAINKVLQQNTFEIKDNMALKRRFLFLRAQRKVIKVFLDDILYIESLKDYITIHREQLPKIIVKLPIGTIESMLPKNSFLRIHRSYIVSSEKVTAFTQYDVEMGEFALPIGRSYPNVYDTLLNA